jgi:hypothetical protein
VRQHEWATVDYYAELGVARDAPRDEIMAAFRAQARALHPDVGPDDAAAVERFKRMTVAYRVLSGPLRPEYDHARRRTAAVGPGPGVARAATPAPRTAGLLHLTRRGARWAVGAGVGLIVAGIAAAGLVVSLQARDADLRARGVARTATVVLVDGARRLEFTTTDGQVVRTPQPDLKSGEVAAVGDTIRITYDRADPHRVITDEDTTARDITLWIVAAKLLVVGLALGVLGAIRLSRP